MTTEHHVELFESVQVRSHWNAEAEKWYFSVVDVVQVLTGSARPRKYWSDLKAKLSKEGSEVSEKIGQLKMRSGDGKERETDAADVQTLLRLIQSIPSPKAEPFKQWLAKVGDLRRCAGERSAAGVVVYGGGDPFQIRNN
jgi:DNA-damage-inducible protein D